MSHYQDALEACLQFVAEDGHVFDPEFDQRFHSEQLIAFYRTLVLIRQFDAKAIALQRTGQMGTYPSCLGQEAFSTGIGFAMEESDVFVPYYRDQATQYLRGVRLSQLLQLWGGDERANLFEGPAAKDLPICVPIATQITHAAGVATAMKSRGEHHAVVTTCGDGATSRGDFYESLNLAGVWHLPLVVIVNNNQWAISVPGALQTAAKSIAAKAEAVGIQSMRVDGNDVCAVYHACNKALQRARAGKGSTLIECVSYRLCDHTTADDATRYRPNEELKEAWQREPIKRMQKLLVDRGLWSPEQERQLQDDVEKQVNDAATEYLALTPQKPEDNVDYVFASLTPELAAQRQRIIDKANALRAGGSI